MFRFHKGDKYLVLFNDYQLLKTDAFPWRLISQLKASYKNLILHLFVGNTNLVWLPVERNFQGNLR
jgi:hypothetical protein